MALCFSVGMLCSAFTSAETLLVPSGHSTISAAIAAAEAGDTIVVADGDYSSFSISGSDKENLTIEAATGTAPRITGTSSANRVIDLRADGTTLRGFTVAAPDDHVAISISGQNITIENNTITAGLTGIQTTTMHENGNALVRNNTISGVSYGLSIQNNSNSFTFNTVQSDTEGLGLIGDTVNVVTDNDFDVTDGAVIKLYVAFDVNLLTLLNGNSFERVILVRDSSDNLVGGSLFASLQEAIDAASDGDSLEIQDGTYQRATIDKSLSVFAATADTVNINGQGVSQGWALRIAAGVSDVTIGASNQGLTFNAAAGDLAAIYAVGNNSNLRLEHNVLNGGTGNAFLAGGTGGAGLSDSSLIDNHLSNNGSVATAYINGQASLGVNSSSVTLSGNTFLGSDSGNGVLLGLETDDAVVTNNIFTGASDYGLLELWNPGASITGNSFNNSGTGNDFLDSGFNYDIANIVATNVFSDVAFISGGHVLFDTVQAAIDAAETGDTVMLSDGDFNGDIELNTAGVNIAGSGKSNIKGQISIAADNVNVSDLDISNPTGGFGVTINGNNNVTVADNTLHDIGNDPSHTGSAQAIYVYHNNENTISQSSIRIEGNTITDVGHAGISKSNKGIFVGDSLADRSLEGLVISGNTISNVFSKSDADFSAGGRGAYGILINWGVNASVSGIVSNAIVSNNTISNISGYWVHALGLEADTPNANITGNTFSDLHGTKVIDSEGNESAVSIDTPIADGSFRDSTAIFFEGNPSANSVEINQNSFADTIFLGVSIHPALIADLPSLSVDASLNYWGASAGPNAGAGVGDNIVFNPWYIDSTLTTRSIDPASLSIQVHPQSSVTGGSLTPSPSAIVRNHNGEVVAGATVTVSLSSGSFASGTTAAVTDDSGLAVFSNLVIATPGNYSLNFTTGNLTAVQSNSFVVSAPTIDIPDIEPPVDDTADPDDGDTEISEDTTGLVDDIVIPEDSSVSISDETIASVSEAATLSNNLAEDLSTNIEVVDDDEVIEALDVISNVAEVSGSATINTTSTGNSDGAETTSSSAKTAIDSFSTLLSALDEKNNNEDTFTELNANQKTSVQQATGKAVAAAVSILSALEESPEERQNLLSDIGEIVTSSVNLGVALSNEQATAVLDAADQVDAPQGDIDSDLENTIPVQPRNKALISRATLSEALGDSGIEEAEIDEILVELAAAINPADIQLGLVNGQDALSTGISETVGGSVSFDATTGTIFFSIPTPDSQTSSGLISIAALSVAKQVPARVSSARIVSSSFPSGLSTKSDGSVVITQSRIASVVVPASYDPLNFYADLRQLGYLASVGANGKITISNNDLTFSGTFDFLGTERSEERLESTSFSIPSNGDESNLDYQFTVNYRDGNSQVIQPYVAADEFTEWIKSLGASINMDRNTGVIHIEDEGTQLHFRPAYFLQKLDGERSSYWLQNRNSHGIAYRVVAANADGVDDIEILTAQEVQILFGLSGNPHPN